VKIIRIEITNFRALRSIVLPTDSAINVIVGPNAIGKSTLLEAVRLTKVLLAARLNNEAQSALIQMGALSQHHQAIGAPGVDISALANDPVSPITIRISIHLTSEDIAILQTEVNNLALLTLQSNYRWD
jgi:recombinational DNA repair ATPase RecF